MHPDTPPPLDELRLALSKATPKTAWGAREVQVDFSDGDARGAWPEWFVHANGVGSYPIGQFHREEDAQAWALLFNHADQLLDLAALGLLVREAGPEVVEKVARKLAGNKWATSNHGITGEPCRSWEGYTPEHLNSRWYSDARAVLRTLKEMSDDLR